MGGFRGFSGGFCLVGFGFDWDLYRLTTTNSLQVFLVFQCFPTILLCVQEEQAHYYDIYQHASALSLQQRDIGYIPANFIITEL